MLLPCVLPEQFSHEKRNTDFFFLSLSSLVCFLYLLLVCLMKHRLRLLLFSDVSTFRRALQRGRRRVGGTTTRPYHWPVLYVGQWSGGNWNSTPEPRRRKVDLSTCVRRLQRTFRAVHGVFKRARLWPWRVKVSKGT